MVSRELAKAKRDLSELRKDALMLEITDASQIYTLSHCPHMVNYNGGGKSICQLTENFVSTIRLAKSR